MVFIISLILSISSSFAEVNPPTETPTAETSDAPGKTLNNDSQMEKIRNKPHRRCTLGYAFVKRIIKQKLNIRLTGKMASEAGPHLVAEGFKKLAESDEAPEYSVCVFSRGKGSKYGQTYIKIGDSWQAECASSKSKRPVMTAKGPSACYAPPEPELGQDDL